MCGRATSLLRARARVREHRVGRAVRVMGRNGAGVDFASCGDRGHRCANEEARVRLARIGMEAWTGTLREGLAAWKMRVAHGNCRADHSARTRRQLQSGQVQVLDVRREPEWDAGHIEGAAWWPLDNFRVSPPEIDHEMALAVHCKGGYRSMIAASLLQRAGFRRVLNVEGGFDAGSN